MRSQRPAPAGLATPTANQARWLLIAIHLPMIAVPICYTGLSAGAGPAPSHPAVPILLGIPLVALQLRHSLAAARSARPRGWPGTLLAVAALTYLPMWLLGWWSPWLSATWFALASVLMLLRGWPRIALSVGILVSDIAIQLAGVPPGSVWNLVYGVFYGACSAVPPMILYCAARLVRVLTELHATRAELAELAVGRERLRVSRDLHDLLGQSLSAVSLKGDLALRLLARDPRAARAEVAELTALARDTLHGMRAVTHDEHAVSLSVEADGAVALLAAAGVDTTIDVRLPGLAEPGQRLFAWAVREGVTNILRHSDATRCSITATSRDGLARLDIVNDGVRDAAATGDGTGLRGLAARAAALSGTATAQRTPDGGFRLAVEIPEEPT
ncbi:hypothetical protein F0L68_00770 [Solihabitans fulvus]|uniref:Signal transduction histidine kinase subgroup 3 dimerisation and phosphoacceptor domain-containing protein n=1 Tax=Solihabitans fulvus TaxID=1892852 RepID=A0A5B2XT62_9PSEU|nr:histidine kinase [Solihabitans fulvus]KAA2267098.1 hypothetical protein F0L68_00770 [Solihabitans fulvus]